MSLTVYPLMIFLLLGAIPPGSRENAPSAAKKIDPVLLAEIEKRTSNDRSGPKIALLIRTKTEIGRAERSAIEEKGGEIGGVLGDVVTATAPSEAILRIAGLEFVVYIEKARSRLPR